MQGAGSVALVSLFDSCTFRFERSLVVTELNSCRVILFSSGCVFERAPLRKAFASRLTAKGLGIIFCPAPCVLNPQRKKPAPNFRPGQVLFLSRCFATGFT